MSTNTKLAEALRDAATSLETIGRLAGKPYYGRDDQGEPIQTYMGHNDEVRSYAKSRAGCAREALAAYEALAAHDAEQAAKAVPAGFVLVPVEVLEDAATAIGHFVSDHGWSDEDMQAMDNLDAYLARHKANAAAPATSSPAPVHQPVHGWTDADAKAVPDEDHGETAYSAKDRAAQAVPAGWKMAPGYRGYALLGTGRYLIDSTDAPADPELGAELVISIASEKDREGREIGERRYMPARTIQPDDMAVRIGFANERGLFALEDQLWMLRQEHWPGTKSAAMLASAPTPPAPEAQHREPLTDDDAYKIAAEYFNQPWYRRVATEVVRATERAHGIGGEGKA